jgi:hypothetical protein
MALMTAHPEMPDALVIKAWLSMLPMEGKVDSTAIEFSQEDLIERGALEQESRISTPTRVPLRKNLSAPRYARLPSYLIVVGYTHDVLNTASEV